MKRILILAIVCLMGSVLSAQDCYDNLLSKGMKEYNAGNYDKALIKWKAALEDCPELTSTQRRNLNDWIAKAQNPNVTTPSVSNVSIKQSYEPEMVYVQGGTFNMADNYKVTLSSFNIGKYEITVKQYMTFANETNSHFPEWLETGSQYNIKTGSNDHYKKLGNALQNDNNPIVGISWNDAIAYCDWLSRKTGKKYRLPTEAEWEYAARGGTQSGGYTYSGSNSLDNVAWYDNNSDSKTHTVGTKQANELGIFDMSGNVREWCNDWYGSYPSGSQTNPTGASKGDSRVIRGGSWDYYDYYCRVSYRFNVTPTLRYDNIGFRVVRYD